MNQIAFEKKPVKILQREGLDINTFDIENSINIDLETVEAFGDEWSKFNYFNDLEIEKIAREHYFDIVAPEWLTNKSALDVGCGTGRWTKYAARYARSVDAVDPSQAVEAASSLLASCTNVRLSRTSVDHLPFADNSFDFVFSLGVLHHIPDTRLAMAQCVAKLKPGGHFLVYLYYRFDNKGRVFRALHGVSELFRKGIAKLPSRLKNFTCDCIAVTVYLPFVGIGTLLKSLGMRKLAAGIPLSFYIGKTYNVIRNDSRDRFGTPLEQRFTRQEIGEMMEACGLTDIIFSDNEPFWHAVGKKK